MQEGGGLDPRIPKIYNTWGLWWIVPDIWFWGFGGPWGAMGGRDDKVMVQVVIYMSCTTIFIAPQPRPKAEAGGAFNFFEYLN